MNQPVWFLLLWVLLSLNLTLAKNEVRNDDDEAVEEFEQGTKAMLNEGVDYKVIKLVSLWLICPF